MNSFSQSQEDLFILNYFGDYKGTLLDVGANDGITFSNSLLFIQNGWQAHCFEPGSVFSELSSLHKDNLNVHLYNCGLSDRDGVVTFWESENHVPHGKDKGLVSTTVFEETKRWPNVKFHEKQIQLMAFDRFYNWINRGKIDFISIDCEGMEYQILQSIDLHAVGCQCLIIEYNGDPNLLKLFSDYCSGFKLVVKNAENLIFVRR